MMKRILTILLVIATILSIFTGCVNQAVKNTTTANITPTATISDTSGNESTVESTKPSESNEPISVTPIITPDIGSNVTEIPTESPTQSPTNTVSTTNPKPTSTVSITVATPTVTPNVSNTDNGGGNSQVTGNNGNSTATPTVTPTPTATPIATTKATPTPTPTVTPTPELILPSGDIQIYDPENLPESYLYPNDDIVDFEKNDTGIYENEYVKLDTTHVTQGYLLVTYKEEYATDVKVQVEEFNALTDIYVTTHNSVYKKGEYIVGKEIVVNIPEGEAEYGICIWSDINNVHAMKLIVYIGLVVTEGTVPLEHIFPSDERIQLTETSKGVHENVYVRIDTNMANLGYILVESIDPAAEDISLEVHSNVPSKMNGNGSWYYKYKQGGRVTLKVALTYGSGTYEIIVWTTLSSESVGVRRGVIKAKLIVTLDNVSDTGAFLLSTGEVIFNSDMQFIKKAKEIADTCSNDFEKVSKIYDWLTDYLEYGISGEYTALRIYSCDLEKLYNRGYGVCFDYAVILAAMLRSQGIPCKVMFGRYAGSNYGHAWNEVYVDSPGSITTNKLDIVGNKWCILDPTKSNVNTGKESTDFMNDESNYIWHTIH